MIVLRPGSLSVEYLQGRRASIVHPIRLFIAVAVLATLAGALVRNDLEQGGLVFILTAGIASAIGGEWAQVLVLVVAAPVIALALTVLYFRRRKRFLEHLVITTEFFTLVLLAGTLETLVVLLVGGESTQLYTGVVALGALAVAGSSALRRAYESTVFESLAGVLYLGVWAAAGILLSLDLI
jgi:hypothetical protein